jgi:uncharacterized protein YjbI with pentapeptide repeats
VPSDIQKIIDEHQRWVETKRKEGQKADLQGADLQGVNLQGANLQEANLQGANLQEANLREAHLQEAHLEKANLQGANLIKANLMGTFCREAHIQEANLKEAALIDADLQGAYLWGTTLQEASLMRANLKKAILCTVNLTGANLQEADLSETDLMDTDLRNAYLKKAKNLEEAENLVVRSVAGTDLTDVRLPESIRHFPELDQVAEASQSARTQLFTILLVCAYTWLTLATTTDVGLLTDAATSKLPIIATSIHIVAFYWVAPLLLVALYIYFLLTLVGLYEVLAYLPAVFPDGRRLDQRAYPWLLNRMVCHAFPKLRERNIPFTRIQYYLSILLAWGLIPLTLIFIWGRYLTNQDWLVTILHLLLLAVTISFGIRSYWLAMNMLRGGKPLGFKRSLVSVAIGLTVSLFCLLIFLSVRYGQPGFLSRTIYDPYADLHDVDVSTKPENWTGDLKQIPLVKGANLKFHNLRYARANFAFLVKADLRFANLQGALLEEANLQEASLKWADLQKASLIDVNLQKAKLHGADLRGAILIGAKLQGADLQYAKLQGADLRRADLRGAKFGNANLKGAKLFGADLRGADLKGVEGLTQAQLHVAIIDANTQLPEFPKEGAKAKTTSD